jgi:hypothetical protein
MNKYLSMLLSTLIFPLTTICMFFLYYGFHYGIYNFVISNFILQDLILFLFYIISCILAGIIFKLIKIKLSKVILISVFVSSGITLFIPFVFYGFLPSILSLFFSVVKLFIGAIIFIFIVDGKKFINQNDEVSDWDKKFKN